MSFVDPSALNSGDAIGHRCAQEPHLTYQEDAHA